MKTLLRLLLISVCFVGLTASAHAQKNVQKSDATATRDEITADLKFGTGKTGTFLTGSALTLNSGSTLTLNGALAGTPTGGTLSLANLTLTLPTSFVTLTGTQTLTNKTLTTPIIASISNTGTLTLPTATDTLIGRATTDTLTGKSLALGSNTLTGTSAQLATAINDETGSGALVFGTAPTLGNATLTGNTLVGALTAGRITLAGASGLLADDADLTFATDTLTATKGTFGGITHVAGAITAGTTTDLDLNGGSSGARLLLGQGASGIATLTGGGGGKLAIGTTTNVSAYQLQIYGATSANVIAANGVTPDGTKIGGTFSATLGGTGAASGAYALTGDIAGKFIANAYGNNFIYEAGAIQSTITTGGNTDRNLHVAALDFLTKPTGSNTPVTVARLSGTGTLLLGTTTQPASLTGGVSIVASGSGATATGVGTGGLQSANFGVSTVSGGANYFGGTVSVSTGSGTSAQLSLAQSGVSTAYIRNTATTGTIAIGDGGGNYLTLATSTGAATFAGAVTSAGLIKSTRSSGSGVQVEQADPNISLNSTTATTGREYLLQSVGSDGRFRIYQQTIPAGERFSIAADTGAATFAGAVSVSGTTATWTSGTGSPESVKTAPVGSLYTRTDGGASTTLYVKESGAGNTGWVAK